MENNPYQSPKANLEVQSKYKRSLWWKIYFFFITLLSIVGIISYFADPNAGISEYISLVLWIIGTIGLFGFCFVKPISKSVFWRYFLMFYIFFSALYYFITDIDLKMGMSDLAFYIGTVCSVLLTIPSYYGLYRYGKQSDPSWSR